MAENNRHIAASEARHCNRPDLDTVAVECERIVAVVQAECHILTSIGVCVWDFVARLYSIGLIRKAVIRCTGAEPVARRTVGNLNNVDLHRIALQPE